MTKCAGSNLLPLILPGTPQSKNSGMHTYVKKILHVLVTVVLHYRETEREVVCTLG